MSDKPPEHATETVTIKASPELLAQLQERWSPPVQVRAFWVPGHGWDLEIRTVPTP